MHVRDILYLGWLLSGQICSWTEWKHAQRAQHEGRCSAWMENQRETTIDNWLTNIHLSKWGTGKDDKALIFLVLIKHRAAQEWMTWMYFKQPPTFGCEVLLWGFLETPEKQHKLYSQLVRQKSHIHLISFKKKHHIHPLYTSERENINEQSLNISLFNTILCFCTIKVISI